MKGARARARVWLLSGLLGIGCECEPPRRSASAGSELGGPAPTAPITAPARLPGPLRVDAAIDPSSEPNQPTPAAARPPIEVPLTAEAAEATSTEGSVARPFVIDALLDVAEAAPVTATERGLLLVNRDHQLFLVPLRSALTPAARPSNTPLGVLPEGLGPFALARGPAEQRGYAYWISRGQLLRQRSVLGAPAAAPEVLTGDARTGTRVAVPKGPAEWMEKLPHLCAYIARPAGPDQPATARLWVEGLAEPVRLTEDTSSAHSVALAATREGLAVVFLEARTGMSSVHLRLVEFLAGAPPSLGPDRIVWVGGPSRSSTEISVRGTGDRELLGLMPMERDITHFGLMQLEIPLAEAPLPLAPGWMLYENGIEPAPFASIELCGRSLLVVARPSSAVPHAPQELLLVELRAEAPKVLAVVARSKAFFDISLAAAGRGALLAYVADHRTWARSLRCVKG